MGRADVEGRAEDDGRACMASDGEGREDGALSVQCRRMSRG